MLKLPTVLGGGGLEKKKNISSHFKRLCKCGVFFFVSQGGYDRDCSIARICCSLQCRCFGVKIC